MYKYILKPVLFRKDPEKAHHFVFKSLKIIMKIPGVYTLTKAIYHVNTKPLELWDLTFPSRVGLAAGFDKDAKLFNELSAYGFGFIEIGTVTPEPQDGNPKPRLFRLPEDEALINRMGFNNEGMYALVERLKKRKRNIIIGGNIGKNKTTPNEKAREDYEKCFETLFPFVDYFVVNVSSPNTPGLRELQDKEPLTELLKHLMELNFKEEKQKPVLLKIAPDLNEEQLNDIISIVEATKINGIVATNTTISRNSLQTDEKTIEAIGNGGLSGKPVKDMSTEVIHYLHTKSEGKFPIIGVGGIHNAEDALEKIKAGATLVQVYSGFIYEGPGLIKKINKLLKE